MHHPTRLSISNLIVRTNGHTHFPCTYTLAHSRVLYSIVWLVGARVRALCTHSGCVT